MSDDELAKRRTMRAIICPTCHGPVPGYVQTNGVTHHLLDNLQTGERCPPDRETP